MARIYRHNGQARRVDGKVVGSLVNAQRLRLRFDGVETTAGVCMPFTAPHVGPTHGKMYGEFVNGDYGIRIGDCSGLALVGDWSGVTPDVTEPYLAGGLARSLTDADDDCDPIGTCSRRLVIETQGSNGRFYVFVRWILSGATDLDAGPLVFAGSAEMGCKTLVITNGEGLEDAPGVEVAPFFSGGTCTVTCTDEVITFPSGTPVDCEDEESSTPGSSDVGSSTPDSSDTSSNPDSSNLDSSEPGSSEPGSSTPDSSDPGSTPDSSDGGGGGSGSTPGSSSTDPCVTDASLPETIQLDQYPLTPCGGCGDCSGGTEMAGILNRADLAGNYNVLGISGPLCMGGKRIYAYDIRFDVATCTSTFRVVCASGDVVWTGSKHGADPTDGVYTRTGGCDTTPTVSFSLITDGSTGGNGSDSTASSDVDPGSGSDAPNGGTFCNTVLVDYEFNDTPGSPTAFDSNITSAFHATLGPDAVLTGTALDVDGTAAGSANAGNDTGLDVSVGCLRIKAGVYPRDLSRAYSRVAAKNTDGTGSNSSFTFGTGSFGGLYAGVFTPAGTHIYIDSTTPLNENQWNTIEFEWDGTTLRGWLNGTLLPETASFSGPIQISTANLTIGSGGTDTYAFDGLIDYLIIWGVAGSDAPVGSPDGCAMPCSMAGVDWQYTDGGTIAGNAQVVETPSHFCKITFTTGPRAGQVGYLVNNGGTSVSIWIAGVETFADGSVGCVLDGMGNTTFAEIDFGGEYIVRGTP